MDIDLAIIGQIVKETGGYGTTLLAVFFAWRAGFIKLPGMNGKGDRMKQLEEDVASIKTNHLEHVQTDMVEVKNSLKELTKIAQESNMILKDIKTDLRGRK